MTANDDTQPGTYRPGVRVTTQVSSFYGDLPDPDQVEVGFVVQRDIARQFTIGSTIAVTIEPSPDSPQPDTTDEWAERLVGLLDEHYADDGGCDEPRSVIERAIPRLLADVGRQWDVREFRCSCGERWATEGPSSLWHTQHQADMLAAAGLLATAEHDAQVAARALRDMADDTRVSDWYGPDVTNEHGSVAGTVRDRLHARADRIAGGAS